MNSIDAPGDINSHPASAKAPSPVLVFVDDFPFANGRRRLAGAHGDGVSLVNLTIGIKVQFPLGNIH